MSSKKRLLMTAAALATIASIVALAAGVTFGLFSAATTPESNTFSTGTVSLTSNATGACTVTNAVPGDTGSCTFVATYTGSVPAYVGLDVSDNTGGNLVSTGGLTYTITDASSTTYSTPGTDLYVGQESGPSTANTFTINWSMPSSYTNQSNTGATIVLTVHAVQSAHNVGTGSCVLGHPAPAGSSCVGAWS